MAAEQDEIVARLWDQLADYDAVQTAEACSHLMEGLVGLVKGSNSSWVGALRTMDDPSDPLRGWRVGGLSTLHDEPVSAGALAELKTRWARREVDPLSLFSLRGAGETFRAFSFRQTMPPDWFDAPYYKHLYEVRGIYDSILVLFPLNADAESVFIVHGGPDRGAFTPKEIALVARILRGIKWFHRRLLLGHGLLVASSPPSPAERKVLNGLLSKATEKEIAQQLNLAPSTVHQYAVSVYRKFGVKGRAGLMSLWLNRAG